MPALTTYYLSRLIGRKIYDIKGKCIGKLADLLLEYLDYQPKNGENSKPRVIGIKIKNGSSFEFYAFESFTINKNEKNINIVCNKVINLHPEIVSDSLYLVDDIMNKQIVDLNGKKIERVYDVRLVTVAKGTYAIAIDVGIEGILSRIIISKHLKKIIKYFNFNIPAKFILWDDFEAINFTSSKIKLSKAYSKLHTLHPSDLADIIEDLSRNSREVVFTSLDEEKAADVLEEMEPRAQIQILENLPLEKAADVLEKMPANEAADILEELEDHKAEMLLNEMQDEAEQEVRELMEYKEEHVGSLMTTDVVFFKENQSIKEVLEYLRLKKPETDALYSIFIVDEKHHLIGTVPLRDIVISEPDIILHNIMTKKPISISDNGDIGQLAEIISKYNLLAVPVVNKYKVLEGMVVIDDIVEDLINKRKTAKN